MKSLIVGLMSAMTVAATLSSAAQNSASSEIKKTGNSLFLDVHRFEPGSVTAAAVAEAHKKDLAVEDKYGVKMLKYWVDEKKGMVFCLASAPDSAALCGTHKEAHGLLPDRVYPVTDGQAATMLGQKNLFLDVHYLGAGNVTAAAVADAHVKDLAVEGKYSVHLINYWVNEKEGVVMCLAEADKADDLIKTHKEAHGLVPDKVYKVKQGE